MNGRAQYFTFHLGGATYALEVEDVQEVLRESVFSAVPLAPANVIGLMNLRGQIVTMVDLAGRLGIERGEREIGHVATSANILLAGPRPPMSFAVDDVGDVIELEAASLLAPPATLGKRARACVRGVHLQGDRVITVLDTAALLEGLSQESRP